MDGVRVVGDVVWIHARNGRSTVKRPAGGHGDTRVHGSQRARRDRRTRRQDTPGQVGDRPRQRATTTRHMPTGTPRGALRARHAMNMSSGRGRGGPSPLTNGRMRHTRRHRESCPDRPCFPSHNSSQNRRIAREGSATLNRMEWTPDRAADAVERHDCPKCAAPAESPCRTRAGRTAVKYHTSRFVLVPALRELLDVATPADRRPGKAWIARPAPTTAAAGAPGPIRIGYAHPPAGRNSRARSKPWRRPAARRSSANRSAPGSRSDPNWTRPATRPPVQGGRSRQERDPDRARAETAHPERGGVDAAVGRSPGRRHLPRTPHWPAHRGVRPQRHGRHALRRPGGGRPTRPRLHPGEDPRRPGRRSRQGPPRRTAQGRRRRHARLRPGTAQQAGRPPSLAWCTAHSPKPAKPRTTHHRPRLRRRTDTFSASDTGFGRQRRRTIFPGAGRWEGVPA